MAGERGHSCSRPWVWSTSSSPIPITNMRDPTADPAPKQRVELRRVRAHPTHGSVPGQRRGGVRDVRRRDHRTRPARCRSPHPISRQTILLRPNLMGQHWRGEQHPRAPKGEPHRPSWASPQWRRQEGPQDLWRHTRPPASRSSTRCEEKKKDGEESGARKVVGGVQRERRYGRRREEGLSDRNRPNGSDEAE